MFDARDRLVGKSLRLLVFVSCLFLLGSGYAFSAATSKTKNGESLRSTTKKHKAGSLSTQKDRRAGQANKRQRTLKTAINEIQPAGEFINYKIEKGDTLESIADKFDLEQADILDLNSLKKSRLTPGKIIRLPKPEGENEEDIVALAPEINNTYSLKRWRSEDERGMLVRVAKSFSGAPYRFGGDSVRGLDCSAFVKKIYDIFEVQLPRSAREQYCAGPRINRNDIATGDLVFFRTRKQFTFPTHVGIYIGEGRFIHASSYCKQGVRISSLGEDYYAKRFMGAVRVKTQPELAESSHIPPKEPSNIQ